MSNQTPHDPTQPDPNDPSTWPFQAPQHQAPKKKHTVRNIFFAALGTLTVIGVAASLGGSPEPAATKLPGTVTTTSAPTTAPPAPKATPTQPPKTTAPVVEPEVTTEKPSMTASQEQAVGSAESYLEFKAFSRKGLIQQLSSKYGEGFSKADATYAVDHITVNWNEQAAKSAESYLEMQHFSRSGLIQQLESSVGEGFTHKQAVYGVSKAGL